MPSFGAKSQTILSTCHPDLQRLMNEAIKHVDFSIICGFRNQADQDKAFAEGKSKLKWPHGNHNKNPSLAVDIAPYPIDWNNDQRFRDLAVVIKSVAQQLGIPVQWGGDWHGFVDLPHYELKGD